MRTIAIIVAALGLAGCMGGGGSFCTTAVLQVPPEEEIPVLEEAPGTAKLLDDNNLKGVELNCTWARGYGR